MEIGRVYNSDSVEPLSLNKGKGEIMPNLTESEVKSKDKRNDKLDISNATKNNGKELSDKEQQAVEELKRIDQKVRAHEAAHMAAGGGIVRGGASFQYTTGPDGKRYATGGEVQIDISEVPDNPQATISKMQQVRAAALAPSDPSPQDLSVASRATSIQAKARAELAKQQSNKISNEADANQSYQNDNLFVKGNYINNLA